jgi:hypothetical protein
MKIQLQKFTKEKNGILLAGAIAITFIFLSSLIWLIGAVIVNKTFDAFQPWFAQADPRALVLSQNAVNAYGIAIIPVDILLLVWWGLSAQKKDSQDSPMTPYLS